MQLQQGKQLQNLICFANVGYTRPHLGSIFEKLLHRKTFQLPAALVLQPASYCPPYHKNFTVITAYSLTNEEKKRIL